MSRRAGATRTSRAATFTGRELDIMVALWTLGPSTVADVRAAIADPLAYTTVLTLLRTLDTKGHVTYADGDRAHRFRALVTRETAGSAALQSVLDRIFGGSPLALVEQLATLKGVGPAEIRQIRKRLKRRLKKIGKD